ncbi:hypothetical protein D3C72_1400360 [compost metagenome]
MIEARTVTGVSAPGSVTTPVLEITFGFEVLHEIVLPFIPCDGKVRFPLVVSGRTIASLSCCAMTFSSITPPSVL